MSTETTNKKIKIDNGTTFGRTYTDKAIDERLQGLVSTAAFTPVKEKANNSLQKPTGLTKTKLVGVGTNGQENIEIGDNLTLTNGKLSATGGGSGGDNVVTIKPTDSVEEITAKYADVIMNLKPWFFFNYLISPQQDRKDGSNISYVMFNPETKKLQYISVLPNIDEENQTVTFSLNAISLDYIKQLYYHFITMTYSSNNIVLYLTIQNTDNTEFTADTLAEYLIDKKVLANGNLHGVVPTYIAGEGGVIKVYYRTPGDSNINPTPDEYQDLSSFEISDLVSPVD